MYLPLEIDYVLRAKTLNVRQLPLKKNSIKSPKEAHINSFTLASTTIDIIVRFLKRQQHFWIPAVFCPTTLQSV